MSELTTTKVMCYNLHGDTWDPALYVMLERVLSQHSTTGGAGVLSGREA